MNVETVQQEITTWDEPALRRLIAYAVVLQDRKSGQTAVEFARKFDDPEPSRWVSLDDVHVHRALRSVSGTTLPTVM